MSKKKKTNNPQKHSVNQPSPDYFWNANKPLLINKASLKNAFFDALPFFILLIVLTFVIYGNSLQGAFLIADDIPGLVQNPVITNFDKALATNKINIIFDSYLFMAGKGTPNIFHVRSVLMHMINAGLAYILISLITNKKVAFATALLFLVHPINTEAVSWISAWIYLALTMFSLLVLIFFLLYRRTSDPKFMWLSVILCAIYSVFFTDNWVFTIPIIVVVVDQLLVDRKINFKIIKNYIPLLTLGAIHAIYLLSTSLTTRIDNLKNLYYNDVSKATPFLQRVPYTAFMTFKQYIFPRDLTIYHEGYVISPVLYIFMVIFTILLLVGIGYFMFKNKPFAGLLMLPLVSILVSFSPIPVAWLMADRYLYRGSIFFCLLLVFLLVIMEKKLKSPNFFRITISILVIVLSIRTIYRNNDWRTDKNLWEATKIVSPYSARVYNNLGDVYFKERNMTKAIEYFQIALQLKPDFADVVHNLGYIYIELKDYDLAKQYLIKSYEMNPYLYQSLYKLGYIEYVQNNYPKSEEYFKKTLEVNPQFEPAQKALLQIQTLMLQQPGNVKPVK